MYGGEYFGGSRLNLYKMLFFFLIVINYCCYEYKIYICLIVNFVINGRLIY